MEAPIEVLAIDNKKTPDRTWPVTSAKGGVELLLAKAEKIINSEKSTNISADRTFRKLREELEFSENASNLAGLLIRRHSKSPDKVYAMEAVLRDSIIDETKGLSDKEIGRRLSEPMQLDSVAAMENDVEVLGLAEKMAIYRILRSARGMSGASDAKTPTYEEYLAGINEVGKIFVEAGRDMRKLHSDWVNPPRKPAPTKA